jgi:transcription antitermination protein NusB
MLNRRQLRIKVLQILYSLYQSGDLDQAKGVEQLTKAVDLMYDLYLYLLLTLPEVKRAAETKIEERKHKYLPTEEDLNPNYKLVNNALSTLIEESQELRRAAEYRKVNWVGVEKQEIFRKMFLRILESETYFTFMKNGLEGFEEDKKFAIQLFKTEIANSEQLHHFFEEEQIIWQDDIDLCCSMVIKTLKAAKENEAFTILPLYKEDDDEKAFIVTLLTKTLTNDKANELLIDELTKNWELDRIAKMDILLLKMGLTELQFCPSVPPKVTINEYIEISKFYSTPKSNLFINGVLDKAVERLKSEGKIVKIGRGLLND